MNYFVNIENTSYDLWQVELLIQSFKKLGLQESLYIAIAENKNPVNPDFTNNIKNHKNKFVFQDQGGIKNHFFSLASLVLEKKINLPLVTLHPDMVLIKPIEEYNMDLVFALFDEDQNYKNQIKKDALSLTTKDVLPIINPSAVYYIGKNIPDSFFNILYKNSVYLSNRYNGDWLEKGVWYLSVTEYCDKNNLAIAHNYFEQRLLNYELFSNFIHYKHGYPPTFNKKFFKYKEPCFLTFEESHPYKAMCLVNSNKSTKHIIEIVENYWKEHYIKKP